jgi:hypothetical protein
MAYSIRLAAGFESLANFLTGNRISIMGIAAPVIL